GHDIKEILYPGKTAHGSPQETGETAINRTANAQPLIFTIEYALAKQLNHWGIEPYAMIGHSIGEYAAATQAGVFTLETALKAVAQRGKVMQQMPPGAMLSVSAPREEIESLLGPGISLAAENSPENCTISGLTEAVAQMEQKLAEKGLQYRRLHTSHAFHSAMMEPALKTFEKTLEQITLKKPTKPYISNVTGNWITLSEATSPAYWARQIRETVNYSKGIQLLLKERHALYIEVGPGKALTTFLKKHPVEKQPPKSVNLLRHPQEKVSDTLYLTEKIGRIWLYGKEIEWQRLHEGEHRRRIPLPGYSFEKHKIPLIPMGPMPTNPEQTTQTGDTTTQTETNRETQAALLLDRPDLETEYIAPGDKTEEKLAGLWEKYFGVRPLGINDDFFELGGDSLKVMDISTEIHKAFNVKIPTEEFFNHPTIKAVGQYIGTAGKATYFTIEPVEEKEYYSLTYGQKRLYMLQQMDREAIVFNLPGFTRLEGGVDREKLERAIRKQLQRHESFKTSFIVVAGDVVQRIHPTVELNIEKYQATGSSEETRIINDFIRPFDLTRAPLLRVGVIETRDRTKTVLMLDTHHIISDGTSQGLFFNDLMATYSGKELPPLRIRYKDYSQWQNSDRGQKIIKRQEEFWMKEFEGKLPQLNIPIDYERPEEQDYQGRKLDFKIDKKDTEALKTLAAEEGVSLFVLLLAMLNILFSRISRREEFTIGTQIAGRNHIELQEIIGIFINTLALRNYPTGEKNFREFLAEVKERTLKAFENSEYPLESMVDKLMGQRNTARNPFFDVMFVWQNMDFEEIEIPGLVLKTYDTEIKQGAIIDLTIYGWDRGETLQFKVEYSTTLFKTESIQRYLAYLTEIIPEVTNQKEIKLREIQITQNLGVAQAAVLEDEDDEFGF
ncbi:MAG: acyltransferase domain-containing protein, partial [bacterium]|nr:acyltransferase domain-containing protein [bacterium]